MAETPSGITGVVLAGGRSSRMGQNKALLAYNGKPLIAHMLALLQQAGIPRPLVSGALEGYACLPDSAPFSGPAAAMARIMAERPAAGYLFVPVDMPLLNPALLRRLLALPQGGYFSGWPLPACFAPPYRAGNAASVRDLLALQGVRPVTLPADCADCMKNINTPADWKEISAS